MAFRKLRRLGLALLVGAAAVMVSAAPAHADIPPWPTIIKPSSGWSMDWHFYNTSGDWTYSMEVPNASVHGGGRDTDHSRYFTVVLTDTSPSPDLCAWLIIEESGGVATYIACDGTVTFDIYDTTPYTYTFTFALRSANNNWREQQTMVVPATVNYPELRGVGNGANWHFIDSATMSYTITRPGATVQGYAIGWDSRNVTANTTVSGGCFATKLYNPNEVAAQTGCSGSFINAPGMFGEVTVENCPLRGTVPIKARCVPILLP